MSMDRRRSPRIPVTGVNGLLFVSFGVRLLANREGSVTVEATRPLRVGKRYALKGTDHDEVLLSTTGTVSTCRLATVRQAGSASPISVYEAGVDLDGGWRGGDHPGGGGTATGLKASLTMEAAHDATVRVLSLHGALLESELDLLVGTSCRLEIQPGGRPFTSCGSVVFRHSLGEGGRHHLGVEFHTTAREDLDSLEEFLTAHTV